MTDFDPDWPHGHVTRDGRMAELLKFRLNSTHPLVAILTNTDGSQKMECYTDQGLWCRGKRDCSDLLNAPAPKRVWEGCLVEYRDGNITGWSDEKMARGEAYTVAGAVFRGRHRIEFPEG